MLIRRAPLTLLLCIVAAIAQQSFADDSVPTPTAGQTLVADSLIDSINLVFSEHVDPPTRDELLRRGVKGMFTLAGVFQAESLGRRISELEATEYVTFLREMIEVAKQSGATDEHLQAAFLSSLLDEQHAGTEIATSRYVPEKEYRVQQQIRDNRYVGIGIQLGQSDNLPVMTKVFPGGPAKIGGGRDGDLILTIDGISTVDMNISKAIDMLRGREGEALTLTVRQPNETSDRTLDLIRGEVPFETVVGRAREAEGWLYDIEPTKTVAYVKITSIRGSTVGELRATARRLRSLGFQTLVLDLRPTENGDLRHTIILADELLGEVPLGAYTDTHGTHEVTSNSQSVLSELPMAVLVDFQMSTGASWVAATLQDNERGVLVGTGRPFAEWYVDELMELPAGAGALLIPTAILHRPNLTPKPDRLVTKWTISRGNDGTTLSKREHKLERILRPALSNWLLLPDHVVGSTHVLEQYRRATAYTEADAAIMVAVEVLQKRSEKVRED